MEMSDQPVFGNNSNKQGKENAAQPDNTMKNNAGVEEVKILVAIPGKIRKRPAELSRLMKRGPILVTPIEAPRSQHNRMVTDKRKVYRVKRNRRPNPVTQKLTLTRMTHQAMKKLQFIVIQI
jgi:fibronectin type 3 domain-containing protein